MIFHENCLSADNSHEISRLICYFLKKQQNWNCRLLQIVGGASRVKRWPWTNHLSWVQYWWMYVHVWWNTHTCTQVSKNVTTRNRYNQVPHLTQDNTWETQVNITHKRVKRLALSQQVTTRLQWTDKKAWQTRIINNKNDPQKKHRLGKVSKNILLEPN